MDYNGSTAFTTREGKIDAVFSYSRTLLQMFWLVKWGRYDIQHI